MCMGHLANLLGRFTHPSPHLGFTSPSFSAIERIRLKSYNTREKRVKYEKSSYKLNKSLRSQRVNLEREEEKKTPTKPYANNTGTNNTVT